VRSRFLAQDVCCRLFLGRNGDELIPIGEMGFTHRVLEFLPISSTLMIYLGYQTKVFTTSAVSARPEGFRRSLWREGR